MPTRNRNNRLQKLQKKTGTTELTSHSQRGVIASHCKLHAAAYLSAAGAAVVFLLQAATDVGRKALWKVSVPELLRKA
jgi:hypothetical protein